jgi:hypothetical protein
MRDALEVNERFADGKATTADLHRVKRLIRQARSERCRALIAEIELPADIGGALGVVQEAVMVPPPRAAIIAAGRTVAQSEKRCISDVRRAHYAYYRDIFGNPFRPVAIDPGWLAWSDGTVRKLAQATYDDRRFDLLPILADALEEAGCTDADILAHCRGPGPHVRGCWVVDLLLGKA